MSKVNCRSKEAMVNDLIKPPKAQTVTATKSTISQQTPKILKLRIGRTVSFVTAKKNTLVNLSLMLSQSVPVITDKFSLTSKDRINTIEISKEMVGEILEVFQAEDFAILKNTLRAVQNDNPANFCNAVIASFPSDKIYSLIDSVITDELSEHAFSDKSFATMFRTDSPGTGLISSLLRRDGQHFLASVCQPIISQVRKLKVDLEIDPVKVESANRQQDNVKTLKRLVRKLLLKVHSCLTCFTPEIVKVLKMLYEKSNSRVPDSGNLMVSSFIFLRYLCPALVSPKDFGLIRKDLKRSQKRALVLVVKVVQNIVNNVEFDGTKEPYMNCMNELVRHHGEMQQHIDDLVNLEDIATPAFISGGKDKPEYLSVLCQYFVDYSAQSGEKIIVGPQSALSQTTEIEENNVA